MAWVGGQIVRPFHTIIRKPLFLKRLHPQVGGLTLKYSRHLEAMGLRGSFHPPTNLIRLNRQVVFGETEASRLLLLLHEFRHALQKAEGLFARKAAIEAYNKTKGFYLRVEEDADRWAEEALPRLFGGRFPDGGAKAVAVHRECKEAMYEAVRLRIRYGHKRKRRRRPLGDHHVPGDA